MWYGMQFKNTKYKSETAAEVKNIHHINACCNSPPLKYVAGSYQITFTKAKEKIHYRVKFLKQMQLFSVVF